MYQTALGQVRVFADARQLRQALINLLSNGVRLTQQDGRIAVACKFDADGVTITVSDDGVGIAADDMRVSSIPSDRFAATCCETMVITVLV